MPVVGTEAGKQEWDLVAGDGQRGDQECADVHPVAAVLPEPCPWLQGEDERQGHGSGGDGQAPSAFDHAQDDGHDDDDIRSELEGQLPRLVVLEDFIGRSGHDQVRLHGQDVVEERRETLAVPVVHLDLPTREGGCLQRSEPGDVDPEPRQCTHADGSEGNHEPGDPDNEAVSGR